MSAEKDIILAERPVGFSVDSGPSVPPPSYDMQSVSPPTSGYPPQPGYPSQLGYPAQSSYPPQPGYPAQSGYPPQPGYSAQPGYPPQPGYPAQPGYPPQPGYAAQPGYPQQNIGYVVEPAAETTQTSVLISGDQYDDSSNQRQFSFNDKSIRMGFIRKVYSILTVQLLITFGIIAIFTFIDDVRSWARASEWLHYVAIAVVFVMVILLACVVEIRRRFPLNMVFLLIFTVAEGVALGSLCVYYDVMSVWIAAGICILLVVALTLFSLQTRIDFTLLSAILFVCVLCFLTTLILCLFMRDFWVYMVYAGLGALIFSIYIIFDTQIMLSGKHKYTLSPEEYIFAALNLYLDIVNLFLYILMIVGGARKG